MKKMTTISLIGLLVLLLAAVPAWSDKGGKFVDKSVKRVAPSPTSVNPVTIQGENEFTADKNEPSSGEGIDWHVISGGGVIDCSDGVYRLSGTIGQPVVGTSSAEFRRVSHGFWQWFGPSDCICFPGDANGDGLVNVGDAVFVITFVFRGGGPPIPYGLCSGDSQGDCFCNVGDAVYIINWVFRDGPPTVTCEEWRSNCGPIIYK